MKSKSLFYAAILVFTSTFTKTSAQNSNPWPTTGPVGIGTSTPNSSTLLHVNNGSVLFAGTTGNTPISGTGTRLMWIPSKGAFRAGSVSGTEWDAANIGTNSIAMGSLTKASGSYSSAFGSNTTASGQNSMAVGNFTTSQASVSFVSGRYNIISGSSTGWVTSDPLFIIGNGTSTTPSNALTVLKDGRMGLGIAAPVEVLHVAKDNAAILLTRTTGTYGTRIFEDLAGGSLIKHQIKLSDNATWQTFMQVGEGLTSANAHLILQPTAGNVGIGTLTPSTKLHVLGNENYNYVAAFENTSPSGHQLYLGYNNGSIRYGLVIAGGDYNPTSYDLLVGTNKFIVRGDGNVGIGTTNPGSFKLAVEGKIAAREIQVLTGPFPDYVFEKGYNLMSLNQLETYLLLNKHLPNIPSAKEVEDNKGINLGEMQVKHLEKTEELYLYLIEMNKKVEQLQKKNEEMAQYIIEQNRKVEELEKKIEENKGSN